MKSRSASIFFVAGIACAGLCFALYSCGRYTFTSVWSFEGATSQDTGAGARMTMRVDPNLKVDALGNAKMLARSSRPYDLNIGFYTDTADVLVRTAVVQSVAIRYQDGEKIQLILPGQEKVMPFTSRRNSNWDGKSIVYHESFATGVNLTNCIAKNSSFTVECEGMLVRATGDAFPFSVRWDFRPRKLSGFLPAHYLDPEILNSDLPRP